MEIEWRLQTLDTRDSHSQTRDRLYVHKHSTSTLICTVAARGLISHSCVSLPIHTLVCLYSIPFIRNWVSYIRITT